MILYSSRYGLTILYMQVFKLFVSRRLVGNILNIKIDASWALICRHIYFIIIYGSSRNGHYIKSNENESYSIRQWRRPV